MELEGACTGRGGCFHRWELPIIYYHKIMVIYLYTFLVAVTLLFPWIIFINDLHMYIDWFTWIYILIIV